MAAARAADKAAIPPATPTPAEKDVATEQAHGVISGAPGLKAAPVEGSVPHGEMFPHAGSCERNAGVQAALAFARLPGEEQDKLIHNLESGSLNL